MCAMWTRIWCVRPVCRVARTQQPAAASCQQLEPGGRRLAGCAHRPPPCAGDCADRGRSAHPHGEPGRHPRRDGPVPRTAAPPRAQRCAAPARPSSARVRATTIRPLVSLSSRCTMPARGRQRGPGVAREQAVEQRAAPVARRRMHHQPGGLVDHQQVFVLEHHLERPWAPAGRPGSAVWAAARSRPRRRPSPCCAERVATLPLSVTAPDSISCCR